MKTIHWMVTAIAMVCLCGCTEKKKETKSSEFYGFEVMTQNNEAVSLEQYKGKVVLVVNTASKCGFTPQYAELEAIYEEFMFDGFEILDFPCNQFGDQSPESDEETTAFCQSNYGTQFAQLKEVEVNGENAHPLFVWLKSRKGFQGLDEEHPNYGKLSERLRNQDPDYASKPDIKWNFTKFLVDKKGNVVKRFEPTTDMEEVKKAIEALL